MGEGVKVNNALENEVFANNPLMTGGLRIRFYAGAVIQDANGFTLGSLCVIDTNLLSDEQKNELKLLDLRKENAVN
jgi:hypothetical protein